MDYILINTMKAHVIVYLGISEDESILIDGPLRLSMINSVNTAERLLGFELETGMIANEVYSSIFSLLLSYMVSRATIDLYADTLAPGIMEYQNARLSELEEALRYTIDPNKGGGDNATKS